MNEEENDFFERCFGIVAGLEVGNEAQAIAKEVVLDEVENLQQENKQLKHILDELEKYSNEQYKNLEYANEYCIERDGCDNGYDINKMEAYEEILNKIKELRGDKNV